MRDRRLDGLSKIDRPGCFLEVGLLVDCFECANVKRQNSGVRFALHLAIFQRTAATTRIENSDRIAC